jgi:hypothetical protein
MKIVIITDSYGGPRVHKGITEVSAEETYPVIVSNKLREKGHEVKVDYASFRKITDVAAIIRLYPGADLYIIQAGIVDAYPRPLSQELTISQSLPAKMLRKLIRMNRKFFIRYVRSKPWTTEKQFREALLDVCENCRSRLLWINIAPVNDFQEKETPGANAAITKLNKIMAIIISQFHNSQLLDIDGALHASGDYESYLHPVDSHLNKKGNILYADEILKKLQEKSYSIF